MSCDLLLGEPETMSHAAMPVFVTAVLVCGAVEPHVLLCVSMGAHPRSSFALDCCHIDGIQLGWPKE